VVPGSGTRQASGAVTKFVSNCRYLGADKPLGPADPPISVKPAMVNVAIRSVFARSLQLIYYEDVAGGFHTIQFQSELLPDGDEDRWSGRIRRRGRR
jgi:hypothetical protein